MKLKHIFLLVLILFSAGTYGQTFTEIRANRVIVSNALRPGMDTIMLNARDSGTLAHKNGRIYVWNGYRWENSGANFFNSNGTVPENRYIRTLANSLYFSEDRDGSAYDESDSVYMEIGRDRFLYGRDYPAAPVKYGINIGDNNFTLYRYDAENSVAISTQTGGFALSHFYDPGGTPHQHLIQSAFSVLNIQTTGALQISGQTGIDISTPSYLNLDALYLNTPFIKENAVLKYGFGDTSVTTNFTVLGDLTIRGSSRTINFSALYPGLNTTVRIVNMNSDPTYKWSFAIDSVFDRDGAVVTQIEDLTTYELVYLQKAAIVPGYGYSAFGNGWHIISKYGAGAGGGASTLNDLTDVTITAPSSGQSLQYNGSQWVNQTPIATTGTRAERLALVNPPIGHDFYQTDERIGHYVLGYNNNWEFQTPSRTLTAPFTGSIGWTGSQTGTGAAWGWNAVIADQDSAHGVAARLTTGSTATGVATISNSGGNVYLPPFDNDTLQRNVFIMHGRVLLPAEPTNAENYVFTFGARTTSGISTNDSTAYGAYFRLSFHTGANVQLVNAPSGVAPTTADAGVSVASLANTWATFTVMCTNRRAWYFINGVQVGYLKTTVGPGNLMSSLGFGITMRKLSGTTARRALVNEVTVHATARTN